MTKPAPAALATLAYLLTLIAVGTVTDGSTFSAVLGGVFFLSLPLLVAFNLRAWRRAWRARRTLQVDLTAFGGSRRSVPLRGAK